MRTDFQKVCFCRSSSTSSLTSTAAANTFFTNFTSNSDSLTGCATMSSGHWSGEGSHSGPLNHDSDRLFGKHPRLPRSVGFWCHGVFQHVSIEYNPWHWFSLFCSRQTVCGCRFPLSNKGQ
jgi:hypothetical protein